MAPQRHSPCLFPGMPSTELQPFIDAAKERGAGDDFLASLLTQRGWPARDVYNTLGDWWERTTGVAVPARRSSAENARDAFLYLLAFFTLATWACALGSLWFHLLEFWLPDSVMDPYPYGFRATVTWQIASILVALPAYFVAMRFILKDTRSNPDRVESGVRKWLTYIALLLAATGVVSDLVCFLDYFLKGELTVRFVLKCVTVLVICGSIFWYYLESLQGRQRNRLFAALALAAAGVACCLGMSVSGTPGIQRLFEADNRRLQDLRSIAWTLKDLPELPPTLAGIRQTRPGMHVTDPESGYLYEYIPKSPKDYELCATFSATGDREARQSMSEFWFHPKGRACFAFNTSRPVPW